MFVTGWGAEVGGVAEVIFSARKNTEEHGKSQGVEGRTVFSGQWSVILGVDGAGVSDVCLGWVFRFVWGSTCELTVTGGVWLVF